MKRPQCIGRFSEPEDPQDPSTARVLGQVRREIRAGPYVGWIVGADIARNEEPVAADPRVHRDVLLPIRSAVRDGRAHDPRSYPDFPEWLAGLRVRRLEPSVEGAVEHHAARGS